MSENNNSNGIGFIGLLTIVFVTLKLLGKIDWSWAWVLSPVWISTIVIVLVFIFAFVILLLTDNK